MWDALGRLALGQIPAPAVVITEGALSSAGIGGLAFVSGNRIEAVWSAAGNGAVTLAGVPIGGAVWNAAGVGALAGILVSNAGNAAWPGVGGFTGNGRAIASAILTSAGVGALAGVNESFGTSTSLALWHAAGTGGVRWDGIRIIGQVPIPRTVVELRNAPVAFLVRFSFASAETRIWTGFGKLVTNDGLLWSGLGELIRIEGLMGAFGPQAPPGRIVASGVSAELISIARGETAEFVNRPLSIYLQGFDDRRLVGLPVPLALRIMTNMEVTRDAGTRTIAINHESPYAGRNRPAAAWYTDRDQQKRFLGDAFCDQTPFLLFKRETWPTY